MSEISRVVSARVPADVAEMFENLCKTNGVSVSDGLRNMILKPSTGNSVVDNIKVPDNLSMLLISVGGLAVGTMVYAALNEHLPDDGRIDPKLREMLCFVGAIATAGATAYGLHKMVKK